MEIVIAFVLFAVALAFGISTRVAPMTYTPVPPQILAVQMLGEHPGKVTLPRPVHPVARRDYSGKPSYWSAAHERS
jgi:hypothetical protein